MDDAVKGGLYIGVWLGIAFLAMEFIEIPASNTVSIVVVVGSFVASIIIVNAVDRSISAPKYTISAEYADDWDEIRKAALARDGYECGNCGATNGLHVHHIVPLSKGGSNKLSNLRTLCEECHKILHPHMI